MQTWMFMMGIQMIIFVVCAIWVILWMNKGGDEYDKALEDLEKSHFKDKNNS